MNWNYEEGRIYATDEKGKLLAETTFVKTGEGEVDIDHTYVIPVLRGQGIASKMMAVVAEYLKEKGLKTTASCSYANLWLLSNKESYPEIIANNLGEQPIACKWKTT